MNFPFTFDEVNISIVSLDYHFLDLEDNLNVRVF